MERGRCMEMGYKKMGSGRSIRGCSSLKRWMAWKTSRSIFFVLLTIIALGAFSPAFAPLPPVSSSSRLQNSKANTQTFKIDNDMFWKDHHPFQIIGGDMHYFRILPQESNIEKSIMGGQLILRLVLQEYWEDRLLRAKALGLNTLQTYVPWNLHEPEPEKWIFEGIANIESFLKLAQELGFLVMLRPGPYICGEWDLGGFPAWLLAKEPALKLRSSDPSFLQLVERWWDILLPKMIPLLYANGGPIIMVQIENEYGSFGDDKRYLQHLVALARGHLGDDIILYTTDGGTRETLEKGTVPGGDVFSAVDFTTGDDPWPIFQLQKKFNAPGKSPPLSAEFYTGWLTHWGERIAKTDAASTAKALETILSRNGSVVLYMAHGGTNFGYFSGANTGGSDSQYKPDLTSYDYDAPIQESGDVDSSKFKALHRVIQRYRSVSLPPIPSNNAKRSYGSVKLQRIGTLFEVLNIIYDSTEVIEAEQPLAMESVGQMFGFLLYVSEYSAKENASIISIPKVHDRAQVFVSCGSLDNGGSPEYVGIIERWSNKELTLPNIKCISSINLYILVENLGRVNYGPYLYDRKGILSSVTLDGNTLLGWKMFPISLESTKKLLLFNTIVQAADLRGAKASIHKHLKRYTKFSFAEVSSEGPAFYRGDFAIDPMSQVQDTFMSFRGWNKGIAFVNDFNLGRFWPSVGPQCNLYVPSPLLQHGDNVVVILELNASNPELVVDFVDKPDFTCGPQSHQLLHHRHAA